MDIEFGSVHVQSQVTAAAWLYAAYSELGAFHHSLIGKETYIKILDDDSGV